MPHHSHIKFSAYTRQTLGKGHNSFIFFTVVSVWITSFYCRTEDEGRLDTPLFFLPFFQKGTTFETSCLLPGQRNPVKKGSTLISVLQENFHL